MYMLSVIYAECRNAEWRYAECRGAVNSCNANMVCKVIFINKLDLFEATSAPY